MPRGCDNPRSQFNNRPALMPWTWLQDEWMGQEITAWRSTRHTLRVVKDGPRWRIAKDGAHLRGPNGRLRLFKAALSAQLAADIHAGVA